MTTYIIPPTVLYIKQHSITKKKYFGKTTAKNPYKYLGSGEYWTDHIKKHGKEHVVTRYVSKPYTDSDTISNRALAFSIRHNIVESDKWANIRPENGLDGCPKGIKRGPSEKKGKSNGRKGKSNGRKGIPSEKRGVPQSTEHIKKRVDARAGKSQSAETKQKISDALIGITHPEVECPHCGKIGRGGVMRRWHFDHCKNILLG